MGTRHRLTDLREEGVGGEDWKRFAKEHICVASGHRQCGAFGGGAGAGWSGVKGKVRQVEDTCNNVNNKNLKITLKR